VGTPFATHDTIFHQRGEGQAESNPERCEKCFIALFRHYQADDFASAKRPGDRFPVLAVGGLINRMI
jgi:hypothetical protein